MSKTILTSLGHYFDFEHPEKHPYDIVEIAHALSHICRYTGHVGAFLSVAQHSVLVSYRVPPEDALDGLLHDASEAYLGDVSTHLKSLLPEYKALEARTERAIAAKFGTSYPLLPSVKEADGRMLMTEVRDLMPDGPRQDWPDALPYNEIVVRPWSSDFAKVWFLDRYEELRKK